MSRFICFDIETLPSSDHSIAEHLRATIKPPATYKKPESIAEWMRENADDELNKKVAQTSLNGFLGSVFCICGVIVNTDDKEDQHFIISDGNEKVILQRFSEIIAKASSGVDLSFYEGVKYVGFNSLSFDLPFIIRRQLMHNVSIPHGFNNRKKHIDIMRLLGSDFRDMFSLSEACMALSIEHDDSFTGADVANAFKAGQINKIVNHCMDDVVALSKITRKAIDIGLIEAY
jgi:predicted PolB exonuclease-like 3'-5' exonuclease